MTRRDHTSLSPMRALLRRLGSMSPLVPALSYTATAWLANVVATVAPTHHGLVVLAVLVWLAAALVCLIVVVWFRDDDWLAAGFLLGMTLLLSSWTANVLAQVIMQRSVAPALFSAPGMLLGVILRGVVGVPLLGGLVALLRWLTQVIRGARRVPADAPPA